LKKLVSDPPATASLLHETGLCKDTSQRFLLIAFNKKPAFALEIVINKKDLFPMLLPAQKRGIFFV
jgi:hypothetical protein